MSNDEIKEFIKDNEENNYQLGISATLTAIITILIKNNITTKQEFEKIQKVCFEKVKNEQVESMTDKEKQQIEVIKKYNDLFGGLI